MFKEFTSGLFKKLEYGEDLTAHRYWPWGKQGGIVLDPTIQFGAPLASNSGIPTSALYEAWRGNKGDISLVAKWYCVDREEIENAIKFEQELLRAA
jgi:uncharacterized protein (DUF433 family)